MFRSLFDGSGIGAAPVLVMLFFMAVFAVVLVRALSRRRRSFYERMARLPLDDRDPAPDPQEVQP